MSIQVNNLILAEKFRLLANMVTLDGGKNAIWKSKSYYKAADILANLDIPATTVDDFQKFDGIGKSIADKIGDFIQSGTTSNLELLKTKYPDAERAFGLTSVSGIGIKKAIKLYQDGIKTFEDLVTACDTGKISNGMIIRGVELAKKSSGRLPITQVMPIVFPILESLRAMPEVVKAEFAGSVRRGRETVRDVDILVISTNRDAVKKYFMTLGDELVSGDKKARIFVPIDAHTSVQVDLMFCDSDTWGSSLAYFTGSKDHNIMLRQRALDRGLTLNEHGLALINHDALRFGGETEEGIYTAVGLLWCPPELREGDIPLTSIPELVTKADINTDWHMHTVWSRDARSTFLEMAQAAKARGLIEIGVTDHTEIQYSWDPKKIPERIREAKEAEKATGIIIHAGCETGVNKDGSLDWPDEYINQMEYVIASIHRSHAVDPVARLIEAAKHPRVKIIGHPTGRMIGKRDIPDNDWDELFKVCQLENVLLEINGPRLDLPVYLIRRAKDIGCKFVLSSDAHHISQLQWQDYAITLARRAGLTKKDLATPSMFKLEL
jgi:DNA polymerase (family 10)